METVNTESGFGEARAEKNEKSDAWRGMGWRELVHPGRLWGGWEAGSGFGVEEQVRMCDS
jgi:hypothetical protein